MNRLLVLYDYRGFFATKFEGTVEKHVGKSMSVKRLKNLFTEQGFHVETLEMSEVDFLRDYSGWFVIYASSEDPGLFYKEYIEDVLLGLEHGGAILIPSFTFFRAHNNKSFQEILRKQFSNNLLRSPSAYSVGEYSELENVRNKILYPVVVKIANGAGSKGVRLVNNWEQLQKTAKTLMKHTYRDFAKTIYVRLGLLGKRIARRISGKRINNESLFPIIRTNKIIIEEFVPDLLGDYKVLCFGNKYFVLNRKNRDKDFRASGSGKFTYPNTIEEICNVLSLAEQCVTEFGMPVMSLDIGENGNGVFLLEYQCVYFGPYTLQFAPFAFVKVDNEWTICKGPFDLEEEYVRSIASHIDNYGK